MEMNEKYARVPLSRIREGFNYRRRYNQAALTELAEDIKRNGLIQPVVVRPRPEQDAYELIVGGRRLKAYKVAFGEDAEIPADVRVLTDDEATAIMMSENGQREDPSVIEDAEGASRMLGICKGDRDEAARRLGWNRQKFDKRVALMHATQAVRDAYLEDKIGVGQVEILAALRREVQDRVIGVFREKDQWPTLEQLKAMAEQSLLSLEAAIFDRTDCNGCRYNTGYQQAMFDTSFEGSRCTNKECYSQKTENELEARKVKLEETYQVVRIVRPGDNSTVIALRADGKRGVGEEQAAACRTCANFGACVSAVPEVLGKTFEQVCFDQKCNDDKVEAFRKQQAAEAAKQQQAQSAQAAGAAGDQGGDASDDQQQGGGQEDAGEQQQAAGAASPSRPKAAAAEVRNAVREYRETIWRTVFHRAVLKLDPLRNRQLLLALIAHRTSYIDGKAAVDAINKALSLEIPTYGAKTGKLMRMLLSLDQGQVGAAFQNVAANISKDMPIEDVVGFLDALDVKLEQFWKVNPTFFDILTKNELDAVCTEIGLADASGKHYASLKNGPKKDFVEKALKVEGFNYVGAIPKLMRWTARG